MTPFLVLRALRKSMNGRLLFEISELAFHDGECTLVTGPNGSGKTTLLKILGGFEAPDRADVFYEGVRGPWHKALRRYRSDVLYLHQQPYMFDTTVYANVAYGLERTAARARVEDALAWVGLAEQARRRARTLSGGEKQRVALARAWAQRPRLLLLDEPASNLDAEGRGRLYGYLKHLRDRGTAFVLTHHTPEEVRDVCDRHLVLAATRLRFEGSSATQQSAFSLPSSGAPPSGTPSAVGASISGGLR